jgi:hypothetical protein
MPGSDNPHHLRVRTGDTDVNGALRERFRPISSEVNCNSMTSAVPGRDGNGRIGVEPEGLVNPHALEPSACSSTQAGAIGSDVALFSLRVAMFVDHREPTTFISLIICVASGFETASIASYLSATIIVL